MDKTTFKNKLIDIFAQPNDKDKAAADFADAIEAFVLSAKVSPGIPTTTGATTGYGNLE